MASLSIRNLDNQTYDRLRIRASQNGVSIAEEVRQILKRAVASPERVGDLFLEAFGPGSSVDLALPERKPHEAIVLSEGSPLDVEGVDLGLSAEEIVAAVKGRRTRDDD